MGSTTAVPAIIVELPTYSNPVQRTVASDTQISGGNLMVLTDPNTVRSSVATDSAPAWGGVAAAEKSIENGDTSTTLATHLIGKIDVTAAEVIEAGHKVVISGANMIRSATAAEVLSGADIGVSDELASTDEVITVRLKGY